MTTTSFTNLITLTDAAWFNDVDKVAYAYLTGISGTNTIAGTGSAALSAYAAGQEFKFIPANTNTGATTLNITQSGASALGAKNVFFNGAACVGGEIKANVPCIVIYDGTQFNIVSYGTGFSPVVLATPQASTSGTAISFTGIPAGVKQITINFHSVSTNGAGDWWIRIGSGSNEATGYIGGGGARLLEATATTSFQIGAGGTTPARLYSGQIILSLENSSANRWTMFGILSRDVDGLQITGAGAKACSGVLDRLQVLTSAGDTFDNGEINISYE